MKTKVVMPITVDTAIVPALDAYAADLSVMLGGKVSRSAAANLLLLKGLGRRVSAAQVGGVAKRVRNGK